MKEIRMVDLHSQYLKIKDEVQDAMQEVIDSSAFIRGKDVHLFQEELAAYMGVNHAIACGNGTDALQVAMMALNLESGDEIITTPFTFISTIEVIKLLGFKPVLVDVLPDTFNLDPALLEAALSERTRAIVPVHLFGQCADMDHIMDLARQKGLFIIEDNAQAIGADHLSSSGKKIKGGTIGDIGTTSFFPSKNLGAFGDGGALFTNNDQLAEKLRSLVNHGMSQKRYYYEQIGVNSRLDTLQAAILRVKLRHLDSYHKARQAAADWYDRELAGIEELQTPLRSSFSSHIFHQYTLKVPVQKRETLKTFLATKNIPSMIYYPVPLHLQRAYSDLGYKSGDLPVAEHLSEVVLSLPIHTEMDEQQLTHICGQVKTFFKS